MIIVVEWQIYMTFERVYAELRKSIKRDMIDQEIIKMQSKKSMKKILERRVINILK